jgi:3-oxoadipate enol-lactonase
MPYAIINKIRVHYEVSGQGDAVLLISGLSAPSVGWALQVKALSSRFQVVTFDNRGVGQTDLPPDPVYGTAQMADDAAALLHELKIGRVHVVGASMGGTIALELALQHPKLVRSLTLACTWAEADARFLHTVESWISLAYRVPVEERYRHVVYPWLFTPDFFAHTENVETAFQRAMAYPHQTKPEAIERQAKGIAA